MGSVVDALIDEVRVAEDHLLRTGIILLTHCEWRSRSQLIQTPTLQKLMTQRAAELGWHPVVAYTFTYRSGVLAGWISIPVVAFKRGIGADLALFCERDERRGTGKYANPGRYKFVLGKTVHRFAFGAGGGQFVLDWIAAQDPRITKVLITKRGKQ